MNVGAAYPRRALLRLVRTLGRNLPVPADLFGGGMLAVPPPGTGDGVVPATVAAIPGRLGRRSS